MLTPVFQGSFKRDRKLMKKRGKDIDKLTAIMDLLINEQPLPPRCENHPLHGKDRDKMECHIEPDWLLEYRIAKETREIIFHRTGSHSDLF